jgi:1-acyl-sn-glycerol-3-phosphate acyltransferase
MSKKDKEKDKRKKGDHGREARGAWMADLRPARPDSRPASAAPPEDEPELSPPTRRSSPVPALLDPGDAALDGGEHPFNIPPLRPVSIQGGFDELGEEASDIAPVGPTEYESKGPPSIPPEPSPESAPTDSTPGKTSVEQLELQIRDLEARIDEMIGHGAPLAAATVRAAAQLSGASPHRAAVFADAPPASGGSAPDVPAEAAPPEADGRATARDLLPHDFYLRQWGRAGMRKRAEEVDEFGLDPAYEARFVPFFDFLYKTYFRVETLGTSHIPDEGRCLIVSNHSGGPLPYDGIMLRTTVRREHPQQREVRWLAEDFIYYLPFVGSMMNRLGAVRACQENAERLLGGGRLVAVFPEGAKGIGKLYKDRYRLQRFGRGGFIRLCLRTRTPIVPCAIVGAEEANPMLYRLEYMAKTLGIPYLPITPTFPALGPLGLLPAPTKWKVTFGEPMSFDSYGPESAEDEILVGRLAERVRATIQAMLDRTLSARQSIWFG